MAVRKQQLERALQGDLSEGVRQQLTIELKALSLRHLQKQLRNEVQDGLYSVLLPS